MNVTPSASMSPRASSGRPPRHEHAAEGHDARHQHPVEEARHVGQRRRHQHHVVGAQPVELGHLGGLVRQGTVGEQHPLGRAGGAGGVQHHGDVVGRGGVPGRKRRRVARRRGRRLTGGGFVEEQLGGEPPAQGAHLDRAGQVVERRGRRPESPTGPQQQHRLGAVGQLPADQVPRSDTPAVEGGGGRVDSPIELGTAPPAVAVDEHDTVRRLSRRCREHVVQGEAGVQRSTRGGPPGVGLGSPRGRQRAVQVGHVPVPQPSCCSIHPGAVVVRPRATLAPM